MADFWLVNSQGCTFDTACGITEDEAVEWGRGRQGWDGGDYRLCTDGEGGWSDVVAVYDGRTGRRRE